MFSSRSSQLILTSYRSLKFLSSLHKQYNNMKVIKKNLVAQKVNLYHPRRATLQIEDDSVELITFSPDSSLIATYSVKQGITIWLAKGKKILRQLKSRHQPCDSIIFSNDSQHLITASSMQSMLCLYDLEREGPKNYEIVQTKISQIVQLLLDHSDNTLLVCSWREVLKISLSDRSARLRVSLADILVHASVFSQCLITLEQNQKVSLYRYTNGKKLSSFRLPKEDLFQIQASSNSLYFICCTSDGIMLQSKSGKIIRKYAITHLGTSALMHLSFDNKQLILMSLNLKRLIIFNLLQWQLSQQLNLEEKLSKSRFSITQSFNQKFIAYCDQKNAYLYQRI